MQAIQDAEGEMESYMEALVGKSGDRPDKDAEAVILTKYIVKPDRSLEFIKAFKKVRLFTACFRKRLPLRRVCHKIRLTRALPSAAPSMLLRSAMLT